jgi:xanthine dehydrogenase accessory factor
MKLTPPLLESLAETQRRLRADGVPHALATVTRTWEATSAKPGAKAVVSAQGEILEGWVGGGCARGAIGRAARKAIERNEPVLVALRPDDRLAAEGVEPCEVRDGMIYERNGCASHGSLDIYVEPFVPSPDLVVLGDGPVAQALATLARGFDFRLAREMPPVDAAREMPAADAAREMYVVVATQGRGDMAALESALGAGARFVAFVGSARKGATLKARLADKGLPPSALAGMAAPAGLHIGAATAEEIALSVLAQVVQVRRGRGGAA